jgi:two-component system, OmpR family, response regulator
MVGPGRLATPETVLRKAANTRPLARTLAKCGPALQSLPAVNILLIEDDTEAAKFLVKGLRESGYSVEHAADGREGLFRATEGQFDLVVTDRMLPQLDGLTVIQLMRRKGVTTPVLVLSALGSVDDRVRGLKAGGDDYLTKPFAFVELLARIEALTRRRSSVVDTTKLKVADLDFDLLARRVTRCGREIELTARELKLLEFLMRRAGQVVTRTMLLEGVWDLHFDPQSNLIDVHISRLRQAIDRGSDRPLIHTVRGSGYVLRAEE